MLRADCIAEAARAVSAGLQVMYLHPIDEAVERAWVPGGPSKDELKRRILDARRRNVRRAAA